MAARYLVARMFITATALAFRSSVMVVRAAWSSPTADSAVWPMALPTLSRKLGSSGMSCFAWSIASDIIFIVMAASLA